VLPSCPDGAGWRSKPVNRDDVAEEARLALLAVGHDVDAGVRLPAHHVGDRLPHQPNIGPVVERLPAVSRGQDRDERVGPGQAADVGREDAVRAALHGVRPILKRHLGGVKARAAPGRRAGRW
jgi:hypothetical protein